MFTRKFSPARLIVLWLAAWTVAFGPHASAAESTHPVLLIVIDGLRKDYVTRELMPNLHALGERGVVGEKHHSVFPTVTRVNAASIATGSYPARHGLMHNKFLLSEVSAKPLDASDAQDLALIEEKTGGHLLTTPSLGELLAQSGKKLFVAGSSSEGTSFLLNHQVRGLGIWNSRGFVRPVEMQDDAEKLLGAFPPDAKPSRKRNAWAVNAVIEFTLKQKKPDVTILWLTDPDHTAHEFGVGSAKTTDAIRSVDAELGRLFEAVEKHGMLERLNIFVTTDHGFSTHTSQMNLTKLLSQNDLLDGVTLVGGQIHVHGGNANKIEQIVRVLQKTDVAGAIFTRPARRGDLDGKIAGTLSFDAIHWGHDRAADILVDPDWNENSNDAGYRGKTTSGGNAGHGSSSPFDIGIRLLAAGPDIKRALHSAVPTGNIDLAPTILHLQGVKVPKTMDGRIVHEILREGPSPESVRVENRVHRTKIADKEHTYEVELNWSQVENTRYINFTKAKRR